MTKLHRKICIMLALAGISMHSAMEAAAPAVQYTQHESPTTSSCNPFKRRQYTEECGVTPASQSPFATGHFENNAQTGNGLAFVTKNGSEGFVYTPLSGLPSVTHNAHMILTGLLAIPLIMKMFDIDLGFGGEENASFADCTSGTLNALSVIAQIANPLSMPSLFGYNMTNVSAMWRNNSWPALAKNAGMIAACFGIPAIMYSLDFGMFGAYDDINDFEQIPLSCFECVNTIMAFITMGCCYWTGAYGAQFGAALFTVLCNGASLMMPSSIDASY